MIGVLAAPAEHPAVREFFELFKTPWEFWQPGHPYEVVLASTSECPASSARLLVVYPEPSTRPGSRPPPAPEPTELHWGSRRLPLYGPLTVRLSPGQTLATTTSSAPLVTAERESDQIRVRCGFNLWTEIETLLAEGQPVGHAGIPTLDLHIEFLRELILNAGLPVVEIPPAPAGHTFVACLTHDVDHPIIRPHRCDHTLAGFLRRALLDTPLAAARGRVPARHVLRNYAAALKLPLVHAGLVRDLWSEFDRYTEIERGLGSTFFFIPRRADPGRALTGSGRAPAKRAAAYQLDDIRPQLERLHAAGCEIALHGIDAWADETQARAEQQAVSRPTPSGEIGVRMHWLYFDRESPRRLEAAGFTYDSTFGYNQTIGYRAGTTQPFRPSTVQHLLELPLHIMDTALFYPSYLHLTDAAAGQAVAPLLEHAKAHGGTVTINWHDRSILPERLWDAFYVGLIYRLQQHGAWFATAAGAVSWFRARRAAGFQKSPNGAIRATAPSRPSDQPPFQLRTHEPRSGLQRDRMVLDSNGPFHDEPLARTTSLVQGPEV